MVVTVEIAGDEPSEASGGDLPGRLRLIEGQALETRAAAFVQLYTELQGALEGGDASAGRV